MNASDFAFSIFSSTNDSEKLDMLYTLQYNEFDFMNESQPEAWIQPLILSKLYNSDAISSCVIRIFGVNMICSELSLCYGYQISILDAISFMLDYINDDYDLEKNILMIMHYLIERGANSGNFTLQPNVKRL